MGPASSKAARKAARSQRAVAIAQRDTARPTFLDSITRPWVLAGLLALLTLAVYAPVNHHPFFTLDDDGYVVSNGHLQSGSLFDTVGWALTSYDLANWHPVTWLSHAIDLRLFGLDPAGHHDVNLLLHLANALLLFWILLRATGRRGCSFMAAALFALHPVNVESVAWIAERKNLLSLFFFLLALGAYRWYAMKPRVGRYSLVALLYALGLMAKPQVITLPFVLLLWDYWPLGRMFHTAETGEHLTAQLLAGSSRFRTNSSIPPQKFSWLVLEKLPLLALSLGSAILTMRAQGLAGAMRYYPLSIRLGNAIVAYARYIAKALWPSHLAVFYPHTELSAANVSAALLVVVAITAFVFYRRGQRYLAVGWLWFLGTLVPMIGIIQVGEQAMADRYAYLSFIGLFLMICWGVADFANREHLSPAWLAASCVAVLLALTALTYRQLSYWGDNVTLWSRMLTISPGTYQVEENLGVALLESGQPEPAMEHFQRVTALVPASTATMGRELAGYAAVAHLYLGAYDQQHGKLADAIGHYQNVLALAQDFAVRNVYAHLPPVLTKIKAATLGNMGDAYYASRDLSNAKTSYEAALQLDPSSARHWIGLGVVEQKSGDAASAAQAFSRATQIQPSDVAFLLLARALEQSGHSQQAQTARQQANLMSRNPAAAEQTVDKLFAQ
jgi:tetratricopeptide (TPR) repeat protein